MNGDKFLLDSNILIYLSKNILEAKTFTKREDIPHISIITYMEIMGHCYKNIQEEKFMKQFCVSTYIFSLNDEIVNKVIALKNKHKIKLPDAIIAATAIESKLKLVTRNTNDFKNIPELNLFNPFN